MVPEAYVECSHTPAVVEEVVPFVEKVSDVVVDSCEYQREDTLEHNGQLKLACVEIMTLLKFLKNKKQIDTVVYAGAAPGWHIQVLIKAFPRIQFYCIDPQPIVPLEGLGVLPWSRDGPWFPTLVGRKIFFISDVYTGDFSTTMDVVDSYVKELAQNNHVVGYMEKLFIAWECSETVVRRCGEPHFQPWTTGSSVELRSVVWGDVLDRVSIPSGQLESKMNEFRSHLRKNYTSNDGCYDCAYANKIILLVSSYNGEDISKEIVDLVDRRSVEHPMFSFFTKYTSYLSFLSRKGFFYKGRRCNVKLQQDEKGCFMHFSGWPSVLVNEWWLEGGDFFLPKNILGDSFYFGKGTAKNTSRLKRVFSPSLVPYDRGNLSCDKESVMFSCEHCVRKRGAVFKVRLRGWDALTCGCFGKLKAYEEGSWR